jgi:hypothetical protein
MPFTLANVPGFADLPDAALVAENNVLGVHIGRINGNAAFGMVRLEVFTGLYHDGDTVILPTSAVDGYNYQRSELIYLWVPVNTGNASTQWATDGPPWTMWYGAWSVDQITGAVACAVGYRGNDDHKDRQANTKDSTLQVFTIAQRNLATLTLTAHPSYFDHPDGTFYTDRPLNQRLIQEMNRSAKYGVVNTEIIYMGVFKHGDTVPTPVSPADGYAYSYAETQWQTSMRWTADDNGGTPATMKIPDLGKGQLSDWSSSVSNVSGVVSISVVYELGSQTTYHTGRVAVFAFCSRGQIIVSGSAMPWDDTLPGNSAFPLHGSSYTYGTAAVIAARNLTPGDVVTLTGGAGQITIGSGFPLNGPAGEAYSIGSGYPGNGTAGHFPAEYVSGASTTTGLGGLVGAFTDASGNVIQAIFIGAGGTFTVPVGATQLQLGTNDNVSYADNTGSFSISIGLGSGSTFTEIDNSKFLPGSTLRASTLKTLQHNIRAAVVVPEFFGPTNYSDGNTVALPTSPIDGYAYGRSDLTYVFDWANTGPDSFGTDRLVLASASIDVGGVVHINQYRFQSGGTNWQLEHNGSLRVLTIARRLAGLTLPTSPAAQPSSGTVSDDSSGTITVDGV